VINKPLILAVLLLLIALIVVGVWYHNHAGRALTAGEPTPDGLSHAKDPAEAENGFGILALCILPLAIMFGLILWRHKR
jgi:hypothetical protein